MFRGAQMMMLAEANKDFLVETDALNIRWVFLKSFLKIFLKSLLKSFLKSLLKSQSVAGSNWGEPGIKLQYGRQLGALRGHYFWGCVYKNLILVGPFSERIKQKKKSVFFSQPSAFNFINSFSRLLIFLYKNNIDRTLWGKTGYLQTELRSSTRIDEPKFRIRSPRTIFKCPCNFKLLEARIKGRRTLNWTRYPFGW